MKNFLLGLCTLLSSYCFAQTGQLDALTRQQVQQIDRIFNVENSFVQQPALQVFQSTNFELDCGLIYEDVSFGVATLFPISKRISTSMGLNYRRNDKRMNVVEVIENPDDTFPQISVSRTSSNSHKAQYLETPLALHYTVLQKGKWELQLNLGGRANFALQDTEIEMPQFPMPDFTAMERFQVRQEQELVIPDLIDLHPVFVNNITTDFTPLKAIERKGLTEITTFFGVGMNYRLAPTWTIALNTNFDFFHWNKSSKSLNGTERDYWNSCLEINGSRLQIGLIKKI